MVKSSKGYRRKSRNLRLRSRERGKIRIARYMQEFEKGSIVSINIDPSYQSIPHPRFQGRSGRITGKQGRAYYVQIRDGKKKKNILVTPEHLVSLKQEK